VRISAREAAERAGVPLDAVDRLGRAAGLVNVDPDAPIFMESDVEAITVFAAGIDFFGEDSVLHFARVIGAAMANIADAAMSEFGRDIEPRLDESNATELERAQAIEIASTLLVDQVPAAIHTLFLQHVEAAVRRLQISGGAVTADLAVGFVDLVGSTALGARLDARELGAALSHFERNATETLASMNGRLVKTIGDEVMFVHEDPAAACFAALALRDHVEQHPVLPSLRGAVAAGGLVRGYGDYYGPTVNVAARAVKRADPGTILTTDDVRRRAEGIDGLCFTEVGPHELRGVTEPVTLHVVERT
jgi:adenylate cyclase